MSFRTTNAPPPFVSLVAAARQYAARIAGQGVRKIVLTLSDRSRITIEVPFSPDVPALPSGSSARAPIGDET